MSNTTNSNEDGFNAADEAFLVELEALSADEQAEEDCSGDEDDRDCDMEDSMDGDAESALASAGFGTDEDYGSYSDGEY